MPCFICEKCGSIDNTACGGSYWISHLHNSQDTSRHEPALCAECYTGKWHNIFEKKHWSFGDKTAKDLFEQEKKHPGGLINLKDYFKLHPEEDNSE